MIRIRIENVVASATLSPALDLPKIALALPGAEYDPNQFPGLIYRLDAPRTAVLLFSSGKAVCTGGRSRGQIDETFRFVTRLMQRAGQKMLARPKIQIQNIVATSSLGTEVNLNSIAVTLGLDRVEYEPEQFPGLVCRLDDPRVVVLIFGSGKLVCTGARRPADLYRAVEKITSELRGADLLPRDRAPVPVAAPHRAPPARSALGSSIAAPAPLAPSPSPLVPSEVAALSE